MSTNSTPAWPRRLLAVAALLLPLAPILPILAGFAGWPAAIAALFLILVPANAAIARRLPAELDQLPGRRPALAVLWVLLFCFGTWQVARLGLYHADPTRMWASIVPIPEIAGHACMSAYTRAAELAGLGAPNVYAENHWPATNPDADATSTIPGLAAWLHDPYQYPPTPLLFFRGLAAAFPDFGSQRAAFFLLQIAILLAVHWTVVRWIGRGADTSMWLLPAVLGAAPIGFDLQFGQVHLLVIALALGGRVLMERGKSAAGAALLAAAIVTKLFPAILLVELLARKRYREVAQVAAFGAAFVTAGIAVLGFGVHHDFLFYQLPRLLDGRAFAFFEGYEFFVSRNFSPSGIPLKLNYLGFGPYGPEAAHWFGRIFAIGLLVLTWRFARKGENEPLDLAIGWLAVLSLGSLLSPLAPSAYVLAAPLWMLTLIAAKVQNSRQAALLVLAWLGITGPPPLPMPSPEFQVNLALQLLVIVLPAVLLWRKPATQPVVSPAPRQAEAMTLVAPLPPRARFNEPSTVNLSL